MPNFKSNKGFKMRGFGGFGNSPVKQAARNFTPEEANEETKAQQSKAEHEGQQVIGQVDRGEISQLDGNKSLNDLQNLQNKQQ
jgi:hypothetical protein